MKLVSLNCNNCGKEFTTQAKRYNYLRKSCGRITFFCSKKCFVDNKKSKFEVKICLWCKHSFESTTKTTAKICCSITCSRRYSRSFVNTENISNSLVKSWNIRDFEYKKRKCLVCGVLFWNKHTKCCSDICSKIRMSEGGRISAKNQSITRRSKNEIMFANLCKEKYINVITNEPMFNGWDADIIFLDYKIAILWNGKWHYSKITDKHSVSQVQTRDKIKLDEIRKMGYYVYIIKDEGRENIHFVNEEFKKFILFIDNRLCNIMEI